AQRASGSVLPSLRAARRPASPTGAFVSLPGGIGELVDALAAALPIALTSVSTRVTDLRHAREFAVESESETVHARSVILAVPAYVAAALLRGIDTTLAALCDG